MNHTAPEGTCSAHMAYSLMLIACGGGVVSEWDWRRDWKTGSELVREPCPPSMCQDHSSGTVWVQAMWDRKVVHHGLWASGWLEKQGPDILTVGKSFLLNSLDSSLEHREPAVGRTGLCLPHNLIRPRPKLQPLFKRPFPEEF